jgi:hypothetical protein
MLTTIDLHDQLCCRTVEINNVVANIFLAVELIAFELLLPDPSPYTPFGVGHIPPKFSREVLERLVERQNHSEIPQPIGPEFTTDSPLW